jgi:hypothetical protein
LELGQLDLELGLVDRQEVELVQPLVVVNHLHHVQVCLLVGAQGCVGLPIMVLGREETDHLDLELDHPLVVSGLEGMVHPAVEEGQGVVLVVLGVVLLVGLWVVLPVVALVVCQSAVVLHRYLECSLHLELVCYPWSLLEASPDLRLRRTFSYSQDTR